MNIFMPVLDALKEEHASGILHRDISPDNLLIDAKGRVVLIDFGAARQAMGEKSRSMSVIMKAGYSPEEQYHSKGLQGPWTDIYAIAATFYQSITGIMPPESLSRFTEDTLVPPSQLGIEFDPYQEQSLLKAMAVRPKGRYQTVEEFQEVLLHSEVDNLEEKRAEEIFDQPKGKIEPETNSTFGKNKNEKPFSKENKVTSYIVKIIIVVLILMSISSAVIIMFVAIDIFTEEANNDLDDMEKLDEEAVEETDYTAELDLAERLKEVYDHETIEAIYEADYMIDYE